MELNRILCVEDEADIREILTLALESIGGFTVESCASGQEALDRVVATDPDLILLDVMMPEMSGPSTLEALQQIPEAATKPVIFLTAKTQASEIEQFKALGAIDVLTKPFSPMTLAEEIKEAWQRHQLAEVG